MFDHSTILITGGTGSWGTELTKQLLEQFNPHQIRIYSRGEHAQVTMRRNFNDSDKLQFIIGDIRDLERLQYASKGVDYIFHLAAMKHVPVCEENTFEAVKTNILGTQNVIQAALTNGIKKVIDVSSDKAASPLNLYGTTKAVGEKLIISANLLTKDTTFVCIRAGNVLGTQGSVVPLFRNQLLNTNSLTITDPGMTRFFMNLKKVVSLLFKAAQDSVGGEIFVVPMPGATIGDLADVMIDQLGNEKTQKIIIGRRPGEKTHELLVSIDESERTHIFGDYYIILPTIKIDKLKEHYQSANLEKVKFKELSSDNTIRLSKNQVREMLTFEDWLSSQKLPTDISSRDKERLLSPFEKEGWIRKS